MGRPSHLLLHVAVETQEAELRPLIGRRSREDGGEEAVEELHRLAARDEDDDFVVLSKLNNSGWSPWQRVEILIPNIDYYLAFVQYESSQADQSELTGNHHHVLLQGLGQNEALRLRCAGVRGHRGARGDEVRGGRAGHLDTDRVAETNVC